MPEEIKEELPTTLAGYWDKLQRTVLSVYPVVLPDWVVREIRRSFYAGASTTFALFFRIMQLPEEERDAAFARIQQEVRAFVEDLHEPVNGDNHDKPLD